MSSIFQPVSWQRMSDAVAIVRRRLLRAAEALGKAGVPYAVIGGNAVAAWVSKIDEAAVRNTRDVGLLLRREDLSAAAVALAAAGFQHRRVASLGQAGEVEVFLDPDSGKVRDAVHIVFAREKTRADSPAPNPDVSDSADEADFRLISLQALVHMKLSAFRDKDRVHLRDLIDVGLVDESGVTGLPELLAERLRMILATPDG